MIQKYEIKTISKLAQELMTISEIKKERFVESFKNSFINPITSKKV